MTGSGSTPDDTATRTVGEGAGPGVDVDPVEAVGSLLCERYAVLEVVGRGSMGAVMRAYDSRLKREVALKRLLPGHNAPVARARMVREAQSMAQLSHRNVVAVFDVDIIDEMVLIAMEYVPGQTLRDWLSSKPPAAEIVDAFLDAGTGLAAAHDAGLVHRDFKPANVLLGPGHRAKVTDFGLAKLADAEGDDGRGESGSEEWDPDRSGESVTDHDAVLGTPRYMAPEQHAGDPAGPRADQYAFCVALWEALAGEPPFRGEGSRGLLEAKLAGPSTTPTMPRGVAEVLRRGLDPEPDARWPGMRPMLDALRPAPTRHRGVIAVGAVVALGGTAWFVAREPAVERELPCAAGPDRIAEVWGGTHRAAIAQAMAGVRGFGATSWPQIERRLDDYASAWAQQYDEACAATHVRREQSSEALDLRMACLERRRRELGATVALLQEGGAEIVQRGLDAATGLVAVGGCADVEALKAAIPLPTDPKVAAAVEKIRTDLAVAEALRALAQFRRGLEAVDDLLERAKPLDYPPITLRLQARRGELLIDLDDDAGIELLSDVLPQAIELGMWRLVVRASIRLSQAFVDRDVRKYEAQLLAETAVAHARRVEPGGLLEAFGQQQLGELLLDQGASAEALTAYERALALRTEVLGRDAPSVAKSLERIAVLHGRSGNYDLAKSTIAEAVAITERLRGTNHPLVVSLLQSSAIMHGRTGDYAGAAERFERALAVRLAIDGRETRSTARLRINLATAAKSLGRLEEAENHLASARATVEAALGPKSARVADVVHALGSIRSKQKRNDEAMALFREAIGIYEAALGPEHPTLGTFQYNLATELQRSGRFAEAKDGFERSLAIRKKADAPAEYLADTAVHLADVLAALDEDSDRGVALLRDAIGWYQAAEIDTTSALASTRAKLVERGGLQNLTLARKK
ncbi:MAG: serine/threonine-protein kinase [Myxococcota bacterium]